MLPALNYIYTQQSKPTAHTTTKCNHLLDYVETYPNSTIWYHASDMILHDYTDYAYLVPPKSRSRIADHMYLKNNPPPTNTPKPKLNSPILTVCQTLKNLVVSVAELKIGGIFFNG